MTDFFETDSFTLPSQVKADVAGRLKEKAHVQSVEMRLKGDSVEGAKAFSEILLGLKRTGVKITHELAIRLDFPEALSRSRALALVESMPRPKNGSLKVRIQISPESSGKIK